MVKFITDFNISYFDTKIYYIQQELAILIYSQLNNYNFFTLFLLFIGGIFTSLNPCLISLFPVMISYINASKYTTISKISLIAGLLTSFISIIILTFLVYRKNGYIINKIPYFSSIGIIIIGLNLLQIVPFPRFNLELIHTNSTFIKKELKNYITGLIFGLGSLPCSTSIIISILLWLYSSKNITLSIIYTNIYIIGYITPIIILINLTIFYKNIIKIQEIWNMTIPVSGCFILGSGILSLLNNIFL